MPPNPTPDSYPGVPGTVLYAGRASAPPPPGPGALIATITLKNQSASATPAEFFPRMFGQPLEPGDILVGEYPRYELADGTPCAASFGEPTYHPDGSVSFLPVVLRVPTSIAGSGSLTINVKGGGSAPSASAVSASTVTSSSDLKVSANALRNWTAGEWVTSVNQGITDGDVWVFANGPAGRVLRVYEGFRQAGADHGQAGMWHYVQVLQNSAGGLFGLRHLGKFANGWHDVTTPQINTLVADAVVLKNGATIVRNIAPLAAARTFSWSSGFTAANITNLANGMAVRLSTTGALPAGLSSNTAYFIRLSGGNGFTLHNSIQDVDYNSNAVVATDAGSGTHTLTPAVQLEYYAAGPYTAGVGGDFEFVQAGGSGSECDVTVTVDRAYRKASKLFGPIRTDLSPVAVPSRDYNIETFQDLDPAQNNTGERPDIGYITGWCSRHFISGTGINTIRTHAYQQGLRSWSLRRRATKQPINLTDDSYPELGAAMQSFRFYPGNTAANSGVNSPADWGRLRGVFDWSHQPQIAAYAYLVTGEPQFLDASIDMAVAAVANIANRNPLVSGTQYSAIVLRDEYQIRVEAWTIRDLAFAAMLTPANYSGAPLGTYFKNILAENFDYLKAEKATGTAFSQTHKFYPSTNAQQGSWQLSYLLTAVNLAYTATGDADAKLAAEDLIANFDAIRVNKSLHPISNYNNFMLGGPKGIDDWSKLVFSNSFNTQLPNVLSYDASTDTFSVVPVAGMGTPVNGAVVLVRPGGSGGVPSGMSADTRYYMRDVAGNSFKLAAAPGGAVVDIQSTGTGSGDYWYSWMPNASNSTMAESGGPKSYASMLVAGVRWSKALGMSVPSGLETAVEGVYGAGPAFTDDTVYALSASF